MCSLGEGIPEQELVRMFQALLLILAACYSLHACRKEVAWNIIVLYLFILETSKMINTIVIFIFIGLRFVPLKYVHPFRTKHMRKQTLLITLFWFTSMAVLCLNKAVTINPILIQPAHAILAITTLYFIGITLLSGRTLISGKAS